MINVFILEGKLKEFSKLQETKTGIKFCTISLAIERGFRNNEGIYEEDIVEIEMWRTIAEVCCENAKIGDRISIQGRIQSSEKTSTSGKSFIAYKFIAEKISFLS